MAASLPGFWPQNVDVFVKLGGSLLRDFGKCRDLATLLASHTADQFIVVFPGGGPVDKLIEAFDTELHFASGIHHRLCARAQDQTGLIFGSFLENPAFVRYPVELRKALAEKKLAVMLPAELIVNLDVFEQSWAISSDTMAAYFADFLGAKRFAILTDVEGVFEDLAAEHRRLLPVVTATRLIEMGPTSVDGCLAPFLLDRRLPCQVLDGYDLQGVSAWLKGDETRGTRIEPR